MGKPEYIVVAASHGGASGAVWASLSHTGWLSECPISAKFRAAHDGERLYVEMEAQEPNIRAEHRGPLGEVCEDSCLEFFFGPTEGDLYLNFELNPLGTMLMAFGGARPRRVRQLPRPGALEIAPYSVPGGWGVRLTLPLWLLRLYFPDFAFEGAVLANVYKCGDLTAAPHYMSWSPITGGARDFHRKQDFGILRFD